MRTVAKPCVKNNSVEFWIHQGAYLRMLFLANKFYVQITPTWVVTDDGYQIKRGPEVGPLVIKWTGAERNLSVLYHVRFWTSALRRGPGPITIRTGDQTMEIATVPAHVQQAYGIGDDQVHVLTLLDQEAPLIAAAEEEMADLTIAGGLASLQGEDDEVIPIDELIEIDFDAE